MARKYKSPEQEKALKNLRRKRLKTRRKFKCDKEHSQWIGALVHFDGEDHPLRNCTVRQDGKENNGCSVKENARECAAMFRAVCPRAEIHIRRGKTVVVKGYNEYDCARLWDFSAKVEKTRGLIVPPYSFYRPYKK